MNSYYVYVYFDVRFEPKIPIYVGKGKGKRAWSHLGKRCANNILKRKISHMKEVGLIPEIVLVASNLDNNTAIKIEQDYIIKYGRINNNTGTLCNFTNGGKGTDGYYHKKETKDLFSKQRKGKRQTESQYKANCSRKVSEETKKRISLSLRGKSSWTEERRILHSVEMTARSVSEETRKKMSLQRKGKKQTAAQYAANCNRIIKTKQVLCINNDIIYESCKEAAKLLFNSNDENAISAVCREKRKHHKGYVFTYLD